MALVAERRAEARAIRLDSICARVTVNPGSVDNDASWGGVLWLSLGPKAVELKAIGVVWMIWTCLSTASRSPASIGR